MKKQTKVTRREKAHDERRADALARTVSVHWRTLEKLAGFSDEERVPGLSPEPASRTAEGGVKKRTKVTVCWVVKWRRPDGAPEYYLRTPQELFGYDWVESSRRATRFPSRAAAWAFAAENAACRKVVRIVRRGA